jgi:hypothetical protein
MILPVNLKPYAKTYQLWSLPISAVTAVDKTSELYIINNLTHVYYADKLEAQINFCDADFFDQWDCLNTDKIIVNSTGSRIDLGKLFLRKLDEGFYIYTHANEKYIPQRPAYLKSDYEHDILVHGYEDDCFIVLGYCDDRHYRSTVVPIKRFMDALYDDRDIFFFKSCDSYEYKLDIDKNVNLLNKYVLSMAGQLLSFENHTDEIFYGINAFYELLRQGNELCIVRNYDFFYEHKKLMYDRICSFSRLVDIEKIKAEYQEILNNTATVRLLAIKFETEYNKGRINTFTRDRIVKKAYIILEKERRILEDFLNTIRFLHDYGRYLGVGNETEVPE